jgi:hypothetical protein
MTDPALERLLLVLALLSLFVMAGLSFQFGITIDEEPLQHYSELVWNFYRSGFADRSALHYRDFYLYGDLFEILCAAARRVLPFFVYDTRHLVNAVVGWIGIFYAARLATRLRNIRAGLLAFSLLILSPAYFAHCMNNPKDLPFATAYIMALYYLSGIAHRYPFLSLSLACKIAISIGLAINVRAGGVLLVSYFILQMGLGALLDRDCRGARMVLVATMTLAVAIASMAVGTVFWPWALQRPLVRPFQALRVLADFPHILPVLFRGTIVPSNHVPLSYAPTLLAITTPLPILAGAVGALGSWGTVPRERRLAFTIVWISLLVPFGAVILAHSPLYDGIRHLLFTYPPLVVLSAVSWSFVVERLHDRAFLRSLILGGAAVAMLDPILFHLRNHPNQNSYFNSFVGGPPGAFKRYDMDYWGNCEKQAIDWIRSHGGLRSQRVRISGGDGSYNRVTQAYMQKFSDVEYVKSRGNADFHIEMLRQSPSIIEQRLRQDGIVHTVSVDGVPLCLVKIGGGHTGSTIDRSPPSTASEAAD